MRREEVQRQIQDEEVEKGKIQQDLAVLTKRLAQINNSLARKVRVRMCACVCACVGVYLWGQQFCKFLSGLAFEDSDYALDTATGASMLTFPVLPGPIKMGSKEPAAVVVCQGGRAC